MSERLRIARKKDTLPVPAQQTEHEIQPLVQEVLSSHGQPLDTATRDFMEPRFGHDFSQVRVHTDERAAESAQSVNALAYTVGQEVVFGVGQYAPETVEGKQLLAHELTHTVQQRAIDDVPEMLPVENETSSSEREARTTASAITINQPLEQDIPGQAEPTLQRSVLGGVLGGLGGAVVGGLVGGPVGAILGAAAGAAVGSALTSEQDRFEEIKKILTTIPTGQEALKVKDDYNVGIKYHEGGGSFYQSESKSMVLDTTESVADSALTFVHEINHAKYDLTGKSADVHALTKDKYVAQMVEEEAEGTVKSIEAQIELSGTDGEAAKASFPLSSEYGVAYKEAVDAAKAKDASTSAEELQRIGREAGKKRVIKGFMDGEVTTSNTNETYPNYYGKYWDAVHATL